MESGVILQTNKCTYYVILKILLVMHKSANGFIRYHMLLQFTIFNVSEEEMLRKRGEEKERGILGQVNLLFFNTRKPSKTLLTIEELTTY